MAVVVGAAIVAWGLLSDETEHDEIDASASSQTIQPALGSLWALLGGVGLAAYLVTCAAAQRRAPNTPMHWSNALGLAISALVGLGLSAADSELCSCSLAGALFAVGDGAIFFSVAFAALTEAPQFVSPAEVSVGMQLETLLGPLWTFALLSERPLWTTLAGGCVVVLAVVLHEAASLSETPEGGALPTSEKEAEKIEDSVKIRGQTGGGRPTGSAKENDDMGEEREEAYLDASSSGREWATSSAKVRREEILDILLGLHEKTVGQASASAGDVAQSTAVGEFEQRAVARLRPLLLNSVSSEHTVQSIVARDGNELELLHAGFVRTFGEGKSAMQCWSKAEHFAARLVTDVLTHTFAFGVPCEAALEAIERWSPRGVLEMGAGSGYWAGLLRARGVAVDAFDGWPPGASNGNAFFRRSMSPVAQGGPEAAALAVGTSEERVLLLVWPWSPMTSRGGKGGRTGDGEDIGSSVDRGQEGEDGSLPFDLQCLQRFRGSTVIYCGERLGQTCSSVHPYGISSSPDFQEKLMAEFALRERVKLPTWPMRADDMTVWTRLASRKGARSDGIAPIAGNISQRNRDAKQSLN
jgi:hypothetical protein